MSTVLLINVSITLLTFHHQKIGLQKIEIFKNCIYIPATFASLKISCFSRFSLPSGKRESHFNFEWQISFLSLGTGTVRKTTNTMILAIKSQSWQSWVREDKAWEGARDCLWTGAAGWRQLSGICLGSRHPRRWESHAGKQLFAAMGAERRSLFPLKGGSC